MRYINNLSAKKAHYSNKCVHRQGGYGRACGAAFGSDFRMPCSHKQAT